MENPPQASVLLDFWLPSTAMSKSFILARKWVWTLLLKVSTNFSLSIQHSLSLFEAKIIGLAVDIGDIGTFEDRTTTDLLCTNVHFFNVNHQSVKSKYLSIEFIIRWYKDPSFLYDGARSLRTYRIQQVTLLSTRITAQVIPAMLAATARGNDLTSFLFECTFSASHDFPISLLSDQTEE